MKPRVSKPVISSYSDDVERRCLGFGPTSTTHDHTRAVLDLGCWELDPAKFQIHVRPLSLVLRFSCHGSPWLDTARNWSALSSLTNGGPCSSGLSHISVAVHRATLLIAAFSIAPDGFSSSRVVAVAHLVGAIGSVAAFDDCQGRLVTLGGNMP